MVRRAAAKSLGVSGILACDADPLMILFAAAVEAILPTTHYFGWLADL